MTHGLQCVVKEMKPTQVIRTNSDILQLAASCWVCPNHLPAKVKNVISHLMIFLDQQKTSLREWPTFPTFSASQQIFRVAKSHKIQSRPLRKQDCFSERDSGSLQSPTGKCLEVTHLFQTHLIPGLFSPSPTTLPPHTGQEKPGSGALMMRRVLGMASNPQL